MRDATAGDLVVKPRGVPHAFVEAAPRARPPLEVVSPGGFERYFAELAPLLPPEREAPDFEGLAALQARYGLSMDMDTAATISEREGLSSPGMSTPRDLPPVDALAAEA